MTTTLAPSFRAARRAAGVQRKFPLLQLLVLIALVVFVGNRDGDLSWADLWAPILLQASFLGIASAGQTLAILVGGLDFSIAAYIVAGQPAHHPPDRPRALELRASSPSSCWSSAWSAAASAAGSATGSSSSRWSSRWA